MSKKDWNQIDSPLKKNRINEKSFYEIIYEDDMLKNYKKIDLIMKFFLRIS